MKKRKRMFEDYEEIALDIATTMELLLWITHLYNGVTPLERARVADVHRIYRALGKLKEQFEKEMYLDCPDRANGDVFHGSGEYALDIRKHRRYIYSSFKEEKDQNE